MKEAHKNYKKTHEGDFPVNMKKTKINKIEQYKLRMKVGAKRNTNSWMREKIKEITRAKRKDLN